MNPSHHLRNLTLAAAGAVLVGGLGGLAFTACGSSDAAEPSAEVERAPRAIVLGQPADSLAEQALTALDVPPTIAAPEGVAAPSGERVVVEDVFGAPAAGAREGAPVDPVAADPAPKSPPPKTAPPKAATPKTGAGAATKGSGAAAATSAGQVRLLDAKMATGVSQREPEGVADAFGLDAGQLWAWVRVANDGPATHITMIWRRDGELSSSHRLEVGKSAGWRTWSRKTLRRWDAGSWTVEVLDADGASLGELRFDVRDAAAPEAS